LIVTLIFNNNILGNEYSNVAGSCEDKLQLLFMMYDRDRSGSLSRNEVSEM